MKDLLQARIVDEFLLRTFRYRTRGFLRMEDAQAVMPPVPHGQNGFLYAHVPFCESLCPFCSFHRVVHQPGLARRYFRRLREEIRMYHAAGFHFSGVYFGGGTPTTEPEELVETIKLTKTLYGVRDVSVETNPRDLRPAILGPLHDAGVTRLSVGVQSFDDQLLRDMERYDTYGSGAEALEHIGRAAGLFKTLNVDLIFNQPRQDLKSLQRDIEILRASGANQVSFYPLMTSPKILALMTATMGRPNRRRLRQFYQAILTGLQPEFTPDSSWCFTRQGDVSDEYIVAADYYVGVGSGAFSYLDGTLYATTFSLDTYEKRIARGLTGITMQSRLSLVNQMRYSLLVKMFGGRLDREWALRRHGPKFFRKLWPELRALEWLGAARRDEQGWQLTERGKYWLMLMMSAFFEAVGKFRETMRAHIPDEQACPLKSHSSLAITRPIAALPLPARINCL
jgi:coproporphyrinogen III oxidase-like Fe-S oxidoreductase